jgi:AraC-like DNA-binding protein
VVQVASDSPPMASLPEWVSKCKELVIQRLDEDIRPEQLAQTVAVSERQLQRMCKEVLDTTPHAFITLIKLEKASQMLHQGDLTVKEVAYAVGFSDPGYFSKVFKKYYNQSPSEMRRQPSKDTPAS